MFNSYCFWSTLQQLSVNHLLCVSLLDISSDIISLPSHLSRKVCLFIVIFLPPIEPYINCSKIYLTIYQFADILKCFWLFNVHSLHWKISSNSTMGFSPLTIHLLSNIFISMDHLNSWYLLWVMNDLSFISAFYTNRSAHALTSDAIVIDDGFVFRFQMSFGLSEDHSHSFFKDYLLL